jgi:hypothetical protein
MNSGNTIAIIEAKTTLARAFQTQMAEPLRIGTLLLLLLLSLSSHICRVFTVIYLKQSVFQVYIML